MDCWTSWTARMLLVLLLATEGGPLVYQEGHGAGVVALNSPSACQSGHRLAFASWPSLKKYISIYKQRYLQFFILKILIFICWTRSRSGSGFRRSITHGWPPFVITRWPSMLSFDNMRRSLVTKWRRRVQDALSAISKRCLKLNTSTDSMACEDSLQISHSQGLTPSPTRWGLGQL